MTSHNTIATPSIFEILFVSSCQLPNLDFDICIFHCRSLLVEISSLKSETPIRISLKKGEKQGINFRPNHRDLSTRNCYSFEHLAKTDPKNAFLSRGTGSFKRRSAESTLISKENHDLLNSRVIPFSHESMNTQ